LCLDLISIVIRCFTHWLHLHFSNLFTSTRIRTPRVFAVEIRKYHQQNPLERCYVIEQCKIAINYKLAILEQCKLTIPYFYTIYSNNVNSASLSHTFRRI
jgi:hypothetical protein